MRRRDRLNDLQVRVLRWIADGCPPGELAGPGYKRTAGALRDRNLVVVSRRHGRWSATITPLGAFYLEHGRHPDPDERPATLPPLPPRQPYRPPPNSALAGLEIPDISGRELLRRLADADGHLVVPVSDLAERAGWRRAINTVRTERLLPDGHKLIYHGRDEGDVVIDLWTGPQDAPPPTVAPPSATLHPLLAALPRTSSSHRSVAERSAAALGVSTPEVAERVLRLLHSLLTGAQEQGCTVDWVERPGGDVALRRDGHQVTVHLYELVALRTELVYSEPDDDGRRTAAAVRREEPTGKLRIELNDDYRVRGPRRTWADQQRKLLEPMLGDILHEILRRLIALATR